MDEVIVKEGKISTAALVIILIADFFAMFFIIGFVWIIKDLIMFFTTKLNITNKRLTGHIGLINTSQLDSPLNKISGVQIEQGLLGKIFNYGTICVTTTSTSFKYKYIDNPNEFRTILNNQIDAYDEARIEQQARILAETMKS